MSTKSNKSNKGNKKTMTTKSQIPDLSIGAGATDTVTNVHTETATPTATRGGRPSSHSPEVREKLLTLLHEGTKTDQEVADATGVSISTVRYYKRKENLTKSGTVRGTGSLLSMENQLFKQLDKQIEHHEGEIARKEAEVKHHKEELEKVRGKRAALAEVLGINEGEEEQPLQAVS